ncbi:MAG: hypothetical protein ACREFC_06775, partial [Stellaceae bacterium]
MIRHVVSIVVAALCLAGIARAADGDWRDDAPGKVHRLSAADLPQPFASKFGFNRPQIVKRPEGA